MLRRRERPPSDAISQLDPDERVVSWARLVDGARLADGDAVVVATPRGLWLPSGPGYRRVGWELIDKAVWSDGVLSIVEAEVIDDLLLRDRPPLSLKLAEPRDLPPTVRKRVETSVVRSEVLAVAGGAARFVARRVPGRDGVTWWARLEAGTRDTAATRASVRERLADLSANWSLADSY
jgi:hypothetical protein